MSELDVELERRTLTYTLWNNSPNKTESKGWHPMTFNHANAAPQKIREIKVNTMTLYSSYHFRFSLAVSDVVYYILTDYNAFFSTFSFLLHCFDIYLFQQKINHVYYETEYRTEWCRINSTSVPCFLFARKFSKGAAMRLLSEGVVGHFDTSALLDPPP